MLHNNTLLFDIVIPVGPNEINRIHNYINYTKKNVVGYRNIYIISCEPNFIIDGCITIDENIFEFKMGDVADYFKEYNGKKNRNGWYFQQLLKLYAGFTIDGILENYLVIDSDVCFLKSISFMEDGKFIFTTSDEHHIPYFQHMKRMHESLVKRHPRSGISHHMIFNTNYVREMFAMIEEKHNKVFWKVFIETVEEHKNHSVDGSESGASEYEMYFNFMIDKHSDIIKIRELKWFNIPARHFDRYTNDKNIDYISICHWMG